jgi:hypothetical protein
MAMMNLGFALLFFLNAPTSPPVEPLQERPADLTEGGESATQQIREHDSREVTSLDQVDDSPIPICRPTQSDEPDEWVPEPPGSEGQQSSVPAVARMPVPRLATPECQGNCWIAFSQCTEGCNDQPCMNQCQTEKQACLALCCP